MNETAGTLTLHNGVQIPALGFGTWQIPGFQTAKCVAAAVKAGYRNFDTAEGYMNEKGLGEGIKRAVHDLGVKREELFVSTKVWNSHRGYDKTLRAFDEWLECSAITVSIEIMRRK